MSFRRCAWGQDSRGTKRFQFGRLVALSGRDASSSKAQRLLARLQSRTQRLFSGADRHAIKTIAAATNAKHQKVDLTSVQRPWR
jgi:hypothetical protein